MPGGRPLQVRRLLRAGFRRVRDRGQQPHRLRPSCSAIPGAAWAPRPTTTTASSTPTTCRATSTPSRGHNNPNLPATSWCSTSTACARPRSRAVRHDDALPGADRVHRRPAHHREVEERLRAVEHHVRLVHAAARGRRRALREDRRHFLGPGARRQRHHLGVGQRAVRGLCGEPRLHHAARASYDYFLPNLDLSSTCSDEHGRCAAATARPSAGRAGGPDPGRADPRPTRPRRRRRPASQGNPALEPLLSKNFDLSFEWYYGRGQLPVGGLLPQGHRQLHRRHRRSTRHAVQPAHAGGRHVLEQRRWPAAAAARTGLHPQLHLHQPSPATPA